MAGDAGKNSSIEDAAKAFIDAHVARVAPLERKLNEAYWNLSTTGEKRYADEAERLDAEHTKVHANAEEFALLRTWRTGNIADPLLARQVEVLYLTYLGNQKDDATIERMSKLEMEIESEYSNFRGVFEGKPASNNDLREVLLSERDSERRRHAWEASKQIGPRVADRVLDLVGLRNATARTMGYETYYQMSLAQQELDEGTLFELLGELAQRTREPFRRAKQNLDEGIAKKLGVSVDKLMPWHYGDFFFQEPPSSEEVNLAPYFSERDVVDLARRTFESIGLDVEPILARSDLFPREGKNQHAFCVDIDREKDVRILANIRNDEYWTSTLLHELGHGAYDHYLDPGLPFLLREAAHTMTTEAVAMLFGRLTKTRSWLQRFVGAEGSEFEETLSHLEEYQSTAMLVFTRWCLVMTHFERSMYAEPDADLNTLWWDIVERFQMLKRPPKRDEPDWAAKLHLALAPVYYHNYMLGEMTASQLEQYITTTISANGQAGSPLVGQFLREKLFAPGARMRWDDRLEDVTGKPLSAECFSEQFVSR